MSKLTVLDSKFASLYYYQEQKIVQHRFHRELDSDHLREVLNRGVDLLHENKACKWLSDNRAINAHSPEDTQWINNVWLPEAIAAGWKYWALVVPDDFYARINMNEFVNSFWEMGVRIMVFVDPDEAMRWLENVDRR
ncbi:MAG: hypothetical protein BroJett018_33770 [Chloroflexota bacterium]|nr:MAG: hypothetical protein BroJett018_33770 [Chloroflexota bacterium]